ncbi:MAG: alpha/beta hydrolase [Chloroflexi bacterium]|nr:alpha/beta hydrolase [Chloroflexota bacterium]
MTDYSPGNIPGFQAHFVEADGLRTRYYDVGSGRPIVLLHGAGWTGYFNANLWDVNLAGLSAGNRVIAVDKIGSGLTQAPAAVEDFTIQRQVRHIIDFLSALKLDAVVLAGHSRGAYLAARAAIERPDLVAMVVLSDSQTVAPAIGDAEARRSNLFQKLPDDLAGQLRTRLAQTSFCDQHISEPLLQADVFIENLPECQANKRMWEGGGEAVFNASLAAQQEETMVWMREGRLRQPVLLYWGQNDPIALPAQAMALQELLSGAGADARLHVVSRAGHFAHRERAADFDECLQAFIRSA